MKVAPPIGTKMDLIEIGAPEGERRGRIFARSAGTSFKVRAATADKKSAVTEIDLYDEIGFWGIRAKEFRARLKDAGDIVLRINSPGGDVFDGIAIYNDLLQHKGNVRVEITGVAASIASIIAMAGDEVVIAPNAFFMVHNAWTVGLGNRHDFAELSGVLGQIDEALARTYTARTKAGIREIKKMMDDETWLAAKDAVDMGFASAIAAGADSGAKAKFDLSVFSSVPAALAWSEDDGDEPITERDWERSVMRDAGWTRSKVRAFKRAIKPADAGNETDDTTQDAGEVNLTSLAEAVAAVSAKLNLS